MKKFFLLVILFIFSFVLIIGCKKKSNSEVQETVEKNFETAEITDKQQDVKIDDQIIDNMLSSADILEGEIETFQKKQVELTDEENKDENNLSVLNGEGKLKLYSFENEILIPQEEDDFRIIVSANEKKVERKYYDLSNRLVKNEEWSIPDVENARLVKEISYNYVEDKYTPAEKIIKNEDQITYIFYNEKSKPVRNSIYLLYKENEESKSKEILSEEAVYIYDQDNRVIEHKVTEYKYEDATYKKLISKNEKRMTYTYNNGNDIPADYKYFENNELRLTKTYSNIKGNYTEQVFFNEGYSVRTQYLNNFKKKEIYTLNGVTVRETDYE